MYLEETLREILDNQRAILKRLDDLDKAKAQTPVHERRETDKLLSRNEAAEYLGVSISTLQRLLTDGFVRVNTIGRRPRFQLSELESYKFKIANS